MTGFERLSMMGLARRFDLDRETVRKRLDEAGIIPVSEKAKEKLYELTPRLRSVLAKTNEKLDEVKLRKESAAAELAEIKLKEARDELVSRDEFLDLLNQIFGAMYQETAVRLPQRIAAKLHKAKSSKDVHTVLKREIEKIFSDLRADHSKFLTVNGNGNGNGKK